MPYTFANPVCVKFRDSKQTVYAWLLSDEYKNPSHEGDKLIAIFDDDKKILQQLHNQIESVTPAQNDDVFIHDDKIYQFTLDQNGITVKEIEINFKNIKL